MEVIFYLILVAVTVVPMWRLVERAGLNPFWSLFCFIPLGVLVLLWILAFRRWPGDAGGV